MSPDPILRRIHACCLASVPPMLWGPPGTGKTARIALYGKALGLHVERWLLSRCEAIDLKPRIIVDGRVRVVNPPELDALTETAFKARAAGDNRPFWGVMFMDEVNLATRETESASLDRMDAPPDGVVVVAAGNPPSRGQAARNLGAPAANRFCHLDVAADAKAWARAQMTGWPSSAGDFPIPDAEAKANHIQRTRMMAAAFIGRRPESLESQPDDPVRAGRGWPSTRTWDYAVRVYGVAAALNLDFEDRSALLTGLLGGGTATEFLTFLHEADLVDPEAWLADPTSVAIDPTRIDRTIAGLTSVVAALQSDVTDARWCAAWAIVGHCEQSNAVAAAMSGADMLLTWYRALASSDPKVSKGLTQPHKLMAKHTPRANVVFTST